MVRPTFFDLYYKSLKIISHKLNYDMNSTHDHMFQILQILLHLVHIVDRPKFLQYILCFDQADHACSVVTMHCHGWLWNIREDTNKSFFILHLRPVTYSCNIYIYIFSSISVAFEVTLSNHRIIWVLRITSSQSVIFSRFYLYDSHVFVGVIVYSSNVSFSTVRKLDLHLLFEIM